MLGEWSDFERWYGPILVHERIDVGFALLRYQLNHGHGEVADYLPQWAPREVFTRDPQDLIAWVEGQKGTHGNG